MSEMPSSGTQKVPGQGYIRSSCLINSREIKEVGRRSKEKKSAIKTFLKKNGKEANFENLDNHPKVDQSL